MSGELTQGHKRKRQDEGQGDDQVIPASDGTGVTARPPQSAVSTVTSAPIAAILTTSTAHAPINPNRVQAVDSANKQPKRARPMHWNDDVEGVSHLALISESLPPLPEVPNDELKNNVVSKTITENEHLFRIVTPINIDRLKSLLINHPNQTFVSSVLTGLREGFWP
jgi:hypothetical protein